MAQTPPRVALITGSSSGIGRATAIALARAGWSITLTARRAPQLIETRQLCQASRGAVGLTALEQPEDDSSAHFLVVPGDITDEEFVRTLFRSTVAKFGRLDMLFNNAGISNGAIPMEAFTLDAFNSVMNTNVTAPFLCTREAVHIFKSQKPRGGRIINNGSLAAHSPRPGAVAYTVAKHAISGLTKSTALEGRIYNITCTQIDIGNAFTPILSDGVVTTEEGVRMRPCPQPNGKMALEAILDVEHVANQIVSVAALPNDATVLNLTIMATNVPFIGRG